MQIKVIGSGSSGNSYLLESGGSQLLLDCGVSLKEIQVATGFKVSSLAGCLLSHEHSDHSKAAKDLMLHSCNVFSSKGTFENLKISGHRAKVLEPDKEYHVGDWLVRPFRTVHDCAEPYGYVVHSLNSGESLLFATDTQYLPTVFNGLNYILIECNHSEDIIRDNVENGLLNEKLKQRIRKSHMSLETLCDWLKACDLSKCKEIYLAHLSNDNSDAERFKEDIQKLTGVEVYVC